MNIFTTLDEEIDGAFLLNFFHICLDYVNNLKNTFLIN